MNERRLDRSDPKGLRYSRCMAIRYLDREFPDGSYLADGERLVEWTDEVSAQFAQEAMLLAQGAERAQQMLDEAKRRAGLNATAWRRHGNVSRPDRTDHRPR